MAETTGSVGNGGAERRLEDPAVLEAQIAATRREMGETIDAIQARLDPDRLRDEAEVRFEQAVNRAKDEVYDATIGRVEDATEKASRTVTNWRDNMIERIKDNPFPAALVGIGLGWLLLEGSSTSSERESRNMRRYDATSRYGYYPQDYARHERRDPLERTTDKIEEAVSSVEQGARRTADRVEHRAEEFGSDVRSRIEELRGEAAQLEDEARERVSGLIDDLEQMVEEAEMGARRLRYQAERQAREAQRNLRRTMDANPLALGAAAVALGAAVGWALPRTDTENELLGEYRDQVVDRAQMTAQRARQTAEHVADEAADAAREAWDEVKQEAKEAAQEMTDSGGQRTPGGGHDGTQEAERRSRGEEIQDGGSLRNQGGGSNR